MKRIRKTRNSTPLSGNVVNAQSDSTTDTYSCNFINGTILFSGSTKENLTLSDSASNYKYLEIFYNSDVNTNTSIRTNITNGRVTLTTIGVDGGNSSNIGIVICSRNINISGNTITNNNVGRLWRYQNDSKSTVDKINQVFITKIIGYK